MTRSIPLLAALLLGLPTPAPAQTSLRFFGSGVGDIDRVKIPIDDPLTALPGPPADVGATDLTIEFWLRGSIAENPAPFSGQGPSNHWITGNIVVDRDRYAQPRNYGVSLGAGRVQFGVMGEAGDAWTIASAGSVLDLAWHHIALGRRASDGWMWLWVDGALAAQADGPDGDISYPDDGVPGDFCGGPCLGSDPFIVLGAEKHDAGPAYPSFSGWLDELRISTSLRYTGSFAPPTAPFATDASTAALWHCDEGAGTALLDSSGAPGGPSDGFLSVGGSPVGPVWSSETPFVATPPSPFVRGDANDDGALDLADAIATLGHLFAGAPPPRCRDAADANDDGSLDISDPIRILSALFSGGTPPPAPHPACGADPTADALDCGISGSC